MKRLSKKQQGVTLIEILISVLVFGVGILGVGSLQIASIKSSNNAHFRTTASMLAMDFSDRMRSNLGGVNAGLYGEDVSCSTNLPVCRKSGSDCSLEDLTKYDIQEVKCGTKIGSTPRDGGALNLLPNGDIQVSCDGGCDQSKAVHNITVSWNEQDVDGRSENSVSKTLTVLVIP